VMDSTAVRLKSRTESFLRGEMSLRFRISPCPLRQVLLACEMGGNSTVGSTSPSKLYGFTPRSRFPKRKSVSPSPLHYAPPKDSGTSSSGHPLSTAELKHAPLVFVCVKVFQDEVSLHWFDERTSSAGQA